jgi:hypothetical protein
MKSEFKEARETVMVQLRKNLKLVIPKPGVSARNLFFFNNSSREDSWCDSAARWDDKPF